MTKRKPSLFPLLLLISFASVFAALFTPALPQMAASMGVSNQTAQLTMTVFLVGYALGYLPYGPLANRWGRKPTLYLGIFIAILGCLLAVVAATYRSFGMLLFARFVAKQPFVCKFALLP
ncbi:MAG: MFS transporter [Verrucomicrobia bacterium]|nr:MFS transporter [Verrucomicrobiota bacterium]